MRTSANLPISIQEAQVRCQIRRASRSTQRDPNWVRHFMQADESWVSSGFSSTRTDEGSRARFENGSLACSLVVVLLLIRVPYFRSPLALLPLISSPALSCCAGSFEAGSLVPSGSAQPQIPPRDASNRPLAQLRRDHSPPSLPSERSNHLLLRVFQLPALQSQSLLVLNDGSCDLPTSSRSCCVRPASLLPPDTATSYTNTMLGVPRLRSPGAQRWTT